MPVGSLLLTSIAIGAILLVVRAGSRLGVRHARSGPDGRATRDAGMAAPVFYGGGDSSGGDCSAGDGGGSCGAGD
jgi:hypothetical protein